MNTHMTTVILRPAPLAGMTLVLVMLVGLWQIGAALMHWDALIFPRTWLDFREGRLTTTLEKQLDQKLPMRAGLIAAANGVRYLLLQAGGDQVQVGRGGWLFLTQELQPDANASANQAERLALIAQVSGALQRRGVHLMVALVPDKARVYAPFLVRACYPAWHQGRYGTAMTALKTLGVDTVDLLAPLKEAARTQEVYYRTDTHWNQTGAQVAAGAVAKHFVAQGLTLTDTSAWTSTQAPVAHERNGDLIRLMGLEPAPHWLRPAPDLEAPQHTVANSPSTAGPAASLFGSSATPVVLTGTSYSLRGNFQGHLQQALSARVLNAAKDGAGFVQATGDYLNDEAFQTDPPQVLVWELPERFLTLPLATDPIGPDWLAKHQLGDSRQPRP